MNKLLILIFLTFGFSSKILGQISLDVFGCNNLTASFGTNVKKNTGVWVLEKLIGPEIWSEKGRIIYNGHAATFSNLPNGTWRIIFVEYSGISDRYSTVSLVSNNIMRSEIVEISKCPSQTFKKSDELIAYPNPVIDILHLKLQRSDSKIIRIRLISPTGGIIKDIEGDKGFSFDLQITDMSNGIYMLIVDIDDSHSFTESILIL